MHHNRDNGRFVIGAFIIIVGILALLDNLDIFDTGRILQFWPTIFIALGGMKLIQAHSARGYLVGATLVAVGVVWTLQNAGILHVRMRDWWPLFLILAGLLVLTRGRSRRHHPDFDGDRHTGMENIPVTNKHFLDTTAVMSGHHLKSDSKEFRGGDISAIMGGIELDLRQASIENEATLRVFAFWGGIEITVPPDWAVVSDATPFMGGLEDKSIPPANATKRLIIKGYVIMGGVEIKN